MSSDCSITKEMTISEAIRICHSAPGVFFRYGMGCYECLAASSETIEEGAITHGVDLQKVLDGLNAACGG